MREDNRQQKPPLQFLGGAGTVTGSKYLIRSAGRQVLLDCGLFQGLKELRLRNWREPPFRPSDIDAVVLSHAHIDHSGYLPVLARRGFRGPVFCTPATRSLLRIMLPDAAHIQEEEAAYADRKGYSKHHPAKPLYTGRDAQNGLKLLKPHSYGESFSVTDGIEAKFHRASHILGSAIIIAVSGMATAGRIVHHLKQRLADKRTTVLLVGYQAAGMRGRSFQQSAKTLRMHGQEVPVRATVETIDGLSAHADRLEILRWLKGFVEAPCQTYIVHGEPSAADVLQETIAAELNWSAAVAKDLQVVDLAR